MQQNIDELMSRCCSANDQSLDDAIRDFPEGMREAIKACYSYANTDNKKGMRYTKRWILECLLMRIKSRMAYQHLRNHKILAVPTIRTLTKYIQNMKPSYGFDPEVFQMLKRKSEAMKPEEKRGKRIPDNAFYYYFTKILIFIRLLSQVCLYWTKFK